MRPLIRVLPTERRTAFRKPTLYAWKKAVSDPGICCASQTFQPRDRWDARAQNWPAGHSKTAGLMNESGTLDLIVGGVRAYPEQLEAWKEAFESMVLGGRHSS